jgi:hypothetical protein
MLPTKATRQTTQSNAVTDKLMGFSRRSLPRCQQTH